MRTTRRTHLDFLEAKRAAGGIGLCIVLLAHASHLVHALDKAEHDEGDDEEVDAGADERPEVDSRSRNDQSPDLGISTRDEVNERLNDVRSQRRDDCRQRTAVDDADGPCPSRRPG